MSDQKSNRILKIVYFNPDDPRVIIPMRSKIGLTLNFGHPRVVTALAWICGIAVLALMIVPIVAHPFWFVHEPVDLIWVVSASLATLGIVHLNKWFAWSGLRMLPLASFGVIAAGVGFAIQSLVNGPLVLWWGSNLTWWHHLVLGPVAAVSQTFGKWFALSLLSRVKPATSSVQWLRHGLLVGLGFAVWELALIYFRVAWAQSSVSYLSLWERSSVAMFHIYSTGLVAIALRSKRHWLIVLVVASHALTDFLAGGGGTLGFSIYRLETIFSACAVLMWAVFLMAGRACERADWSREQIQPGRREDCPPASHAT